MSNKLVEHKESKEILTGNQKKILFWICFIILLWDYLVKAKKNEKKNT